MPNGVYRDAATPTGYVRPGILSVSESASYSVSLRRRPRDKKSCGFVVLADAGSPSITSGFLACCLISLNCRK